MKSLMLATILITSVLLAGCQGQGWQRALMANQDDIDARLVNYALPENGTMMLVSEDNPEHPASTLNNGIKSSEDWDNGEGWETHFEGRYAYGRYFGYGDNAWAAEMAAMEREREQMLSGERQQRVEINPEEFEEEDDNWRGVRGNSSFGGRMASAMGWVVFQFPEEKLVSRVVVYTIDSEKYPAEKYGVKHLRLQYWSLKAKGWHNVERFGKSVGQQFDSIRDIKTGKITFRFQPVRTTKLRLVVLWTNDGERHRRGYFNYAEGTVRLIEVEIYGSEKKTESSAVTDDELSQLLNEPETTESAKTISTPEHSVPAGDISTAAIEATIRRYERAYRSKDLPGLMSQISSDYSRDGETYQQLQAKMQNLFDKYEDINFTLRALRIEQKPPNASAEANYSLTLKSSGIEPASHSGKLYFTLKNADGKWKITQIHTSR